MIRMGMRMCDWLCLLRLLRVFGFCSFVQERVFLGSDVEFDPWLKETQLL